MNKSDIVIAGAARTAMGGFQGVFKDVSASELGGHAIAAAVARAGLAADQIDEVLMGCVLPAGQGQAPARQAAIKGGLPHSVPATTVNKMCGSGMRTVMAARDLIATGGAGIVVAGGMESMSRAPYILPKAREGMRLGHGQVLDHMFLDGLEDAYEGRLMGSFAEDCARAYQFTREAQDAYALASLDRARRAIADGSFRAEITAVEVSGRGGKAVVDMDEQPGKADPSKIPTLKPAFAKDGTVTAANSSSISDGAAALVLTTLGEAERRGLTPLARIIGQASHARAPSQFTTAPVGALKRLFEITGWTAGDVELYEINEAFAVVAMVAMRELDLPHDKVNVNGGACALGHPIGASGARILVTLMEALKARDLRRGVASLCIGGGEATAVAIERLN